MRLNGEGKGQQPLGAGHHAGAPRPDPFGEQAEVEIRKKLVTVKVTKPAFVRNGQKLA